MKKALLFLAAGLGAAGLCLCIRRKTAK